MQNDTKNMLAAVVVVAILSVVVALVALGPQVKNMFTNAVDVQATDDAHAGLSMLLYKGSDDMRVAAVPVTASAAAAAAVSAAPADEPRPAAVVPERTEYQGMSALEVADARAAGRRLTGTVREMGGSVIESRTTQGTAAAGPEVRLRLRVPNARFDEFVDALHELGDVLEEEVHGIDRTEEYGAATAALAEQQRTVRTLPGDKRDSAAQQQRTEAANRQAHLAAQHRALAARTEATVFAVTLREPALTAAAEIAGGSAAQLRAAAATAVEYAAWGAALIIIAAGAALPWLLAGALVLKVAGRWRQPAAALPASRTAGECV